MNIAIENINKIENTHKHNKTHWRKICKVIQQDLFEETEVFPEDFLEQFKNNTNETHHNQTDVKNDLKRMTTEQIL